jgi:hypothetical protein
MLSRKILLVALVVGGCIACSEKQAPTLANNSRYTRTNCLAGTLQPLYVVNNTVVSCDSVNRINPARMASVSLLKNNEAVVAYGSRAVHGAVVIVLKK